MKKQYKLTAIFIIVILILVNLCGCVDPYAAYRYPTAKDVVEASGEYTVKNVFGEEELNGVICYLFDYVGNGNYTSLILIKNENGYCGKDIYSEFDTKISSYSKGILTRIIYYKKFNKYIIEIYLRKCEKEPVVTDLMQSESVKISITQTSYMAYLVLDRIPEDYKICVDSIWYPLPQSLMESFDDIPPQ